MEEMILFIDKALKLYYSKRKKLKKELREVEEIIKTLEEVKGGDKNDRI